MRRLRCIRVAAQVEVAVLRGGSFSSTSSARASIGNGGGSAVRSTSTTQSPISTSPVGRFGVDGALRAGRARRRSIRTTYSLRTSMCVVDDALHDAGVVADVDERQVLAVLAAAGDPAADVTVCADVLGAQLAAEVGAHGGGEVGIVM